MTDDISELFVGSRHVPQFRSPAEFAPHAAWLLKDKLLDRSNCKCKYCARKGSGRRTNQRGRSVNSGVNSPVPTSTKPYERVLSPSVQGPTALRPPRRYASSTSSRASERSIRGTARRIGLYKTSPPQEQEGNKQNAPLPAQLSDFTALARGQLYRDQELIWFFLDKPLHTTVPSSPGVDHVIHLWPGVLKTIVPASTTLSPNQCETIESPKVFYLVSVPSVERSYLVPQTSIIPFQAHRPDEVLLAELRSLGKEVPLNGVDIGFDPLPRSSTLKTTVSLGIATKSSPLELLITDISIAKRVAYFWTAVDERSFPNPDLPKPTFHASPPQPMKIGSSPPGASTDQGYRGLWWGAERVWVGDLLRLSFPLGRLDYTRVRPSYFDGDAYIDQQGSEEEPVFMKLKSLVPLTTEKGSEMYATGHLFKLTQPFCAPSDRPELGGGLGLPRPPEGLEFKFVLSADTEARIPLSLVRGRYYPRLLSSIDKQSLQEERRLQEMEGLTWTGSAAKGPVKYREGDRESAILDARRAFVLGSPSVD